MMPNIVPFSPKAPSQFNNFHKTKWDAKSNGALGIGAEKNGQHGIPDECINRELSAFLTHSRMINSKIPKENTS